jgi:tRNA nucleotidyltransferase (CCA-adding enzyme)
MRDLRDGLVRVLHSMSFIDDPTRILRAIRYARRFGFDIEPRTRQLIGETVQMGIFDASYNQRMLLELRRSFLEPEFHEMLKDIMELGVDALIYPGLQPDSDMVQRAKRIPRAVGRYKKLIRADKPDLTLVQEQNLVSNLVSREVRRYCESYNLDLARRGVLRSTARDNFNQIREEILGNAPRSVIYSRLKNFKPEALLYLLAYDEKPLLLPAVKQFLEDRKLDTWLSGKDLVDMGYKPSPRFKKVLNRLLMERIDGNIKTKEEERRLANKLMDEYRPTSGPARRGKKN